jgi:hypothetical protein
LLVAVAVEAAVEAKAVQEPVVPAEMVVVQTLLLPERLATMSFLVTAAVVEPVTEAFRIQ